VRIGLNRPLSGFSNSDSLESKVDRPRNCFEKAYAMTKWPEGENAMPQREINAKDILRDIRSGLNDKALMEKYKLSPAALKTVFDELVAARLLERSEDGSIITNIRRIEVKKVVEDILSGRTAFELMSDYKLSAILLRDLCRQLIESKALRRDQLGRELVLRMDAAVPGEIRREARGKVDFDVDVFESERPNIVGKVLEVSKRGLRTVGIPAVPGKITGFRISGDVFGQFEAFQFEAQCQWTKGVLHSKDFVGGYEIVRVTEQDSRELGKLITLAGLKTPSNQRTPEDIGDRLIEPAGAGLATSWTKSDRPSEAKKTVKSKELLADIRSGMDDAALMDKYRLSSRGVLQAVNKLIWEGLMSPSELAERRSLAKTVYMPVFKCPVCSDIQFTKAEKCPKCGAALKSLREKKSPLG
jgi:uncharacterized protein (DUF433 family)